MVSVSAKAQGKVETGQVMDDLAPEPRHHAISFEAAPRSEENQFGQPVSFQGNSRVE